MAQNSGKVFPSKIKSKVLPNMAPKTFIPGAITACKDSLRNSLFIMCLKKGILLGFAFANYS